MAGLVNAKALNLYLRIFCFLDEHCLFLDKFSPETTNFFGPQSVLPSETKILELSLGRSGFCCCCNISFQMPSHVVYSRPRVCFCLMPSLPPTYNGIAGSYGNSIFSFLRGPHTLFLVVILIYIPTSSV
jgi:hypothetical protein